MPPCVAVAECLLVVVAVHRCVAVVVVGARVALAQSYVQTTMV
jgi:hypothetical protein